MRKRLLMLMLFALVGVFPASAQDDDNPLLTMLARVPNNLASREWLTYIDYDAVIRARPGAPQVQSWEEFEALQSERSDETRLFMSGLMSIQSGPGSLLRYLMQAGETPQWVGFDVFEVERAVEFGQPPGNVIMLEGDFDTDAIIAVHNARDYTQTSVDDFTLLCPPAGCDTGMQVNIENRNVANPFGGDLGRNQPVLLGDGVVVSSTDNHALNKLAVVIAGEQESLADQPDYRAAAEAVASVGTVLQTYFISPLDVSSSGMMSLLMGPNMTQEQIEAIRERLLESSSDLPQYQLITIAHTVNGDEEQAIVALTYADSEAAQIAAEVIPQRLETYVSLATNAPFLAMFTENGVTLETSVYEPEGSRPTVLVTFRSALPSAEVAEIPTETRALGIPYARLVQAYMRRDLGWLMTEF